MRNSTELRRFSSPHPSLFFSKFLVQFLGSNEKGMEARSYIGWETPCRPLGGGGDRTPSLHTPPARDLFANSKKNYIKVLSSVAWATGPCRPWGGRPGAIFKIFQNGHIFLKFLFFKYKKEKDACKPIGGQGPAEGTRWARPKTGRGTRVAAWFI